MHTIRTINSFAHKVFDLYINGFRQMPSWGIKMWIIIFIKLFILFGILRFCFFKDTLQTRFKTDNQRSEHVINRLINNN